MNILIFDTETTGLIDADMIEFASLCLNGDATQDISYKVKPTKPILPSSTVIHGVTQEEANTYDEPEVVIPSIYEYLLSIPTPLCFVGHNINYDIDIVNRAFIKYIGHEFKPKIVIDTIRLAKKLIPFDEIGGYNLDAVFYYLFPTKLKDLFKMRAIHNAMNDCDLTQYVLIALKTKYDSNNEKVSNWEEFIEYVNKPIDLSENEWTFGKHKGIKFKNTPRSYITWCLNSDFGRDPKNCDIVYTLKKIVHG